MKTRLLAIILTILAAMALQAQLPMPYKDDQNEIAIQPKYDTALNFSDGMEEVNIGGKQELFTVIDGKWGYIDPIGKEVVTVKYDRVKPVVHFDLRK